MLLSATWYAVETKESAIFLFGGGVRERKRNRREGDLVVVAMPIPTPFVSCAQFAGVVAALNTSVAVASSFADTPLLPSGQG